MKTIALILLTALMTVGCENPVEYVDRPYEVRDTVVVRDTLIVRDTTVTVVTVLDSVGLRSVGTIVAGDVSAQLDWYATSLSQDATTLTVSVWANIEGWFNGEGHVCGKHLVWDWKWNSSYTYYNYWSQSVTRAEVSRYLGWHLYTMSRTPSYAYFFVDGIQVGGGPCEPYVSGDIPAQMIALKSMAGQFDNFVVARCAFTQNFNPNNVTYSNALIAVDFSAPIRNLVVGGPVVTGRSILLGREI